MMFYKNLTTNRIIPIIKEKLPAINAKSQDSIGKDRSRKNQDLQHSVLETHERKGML
jgi:hypothetical protein